MAYATASEVATYTGVNVDSDLVTQAQTIVELYSNRTEASSGAMSARDLHWLKLATCYQAAYLDQHDLMGLMDLSSYSQGDVSMNFRNSSDAAMVAPLAKKALGQLAWNRTRSIKIGSDFVRNEDIISGATDADEDEYIWQAL